MSFENLEVWKRSARLSGNIYKELKTLKDYGFKDQITRSGLSIPSNIAEGIERTSNKETINVTIQVSTEKLADSPKCNCLAVLQMCSSRSNSFTFVCWSG